MNNVLKNGIENKYIKLFNSLRHHQSHGNLKLGGIVPLFPVGIFNFSGVNIKCGFALNTKNLI